MRFLSLIFLYCCISLHSFAGIFDAKFFTLENGLDVILIENDRAPVVHHMLIYKVGGVDEIEGQTGLAHYLEHLLFKGTTTRKPGAYSRAIREVGGTHNAFTSNDITAYYATVPKAYLEDVMRLEADRMQNLKVPQEEAISEKSVVIEEKRQRLDGDPTAQFFEKLRDVLYPAHPYGRPLIGYEADLQKMTYEQAKAFYDLYYAPNNAVLLISGDVRAKNVLPRIRDIYGGLAKTDVKRSEFPVLSETGQNHVTMTSPKIKEPLFVKVWHAPSWVEAPKDAYAMTVLTDILAGGPSDYLYQELVVTQKKAIDISMNYYAQQRQVGSLWLTATPAKNVRFKELENAINKALVQFSETELDQGQIKNSKTRLIDSAIFTRDSISAPASIIGRAFALGIPLDDIENWPSKIRHVEKSRMDKLLKHYFSVKNNTYSVTGHLDKEEGKL